MIEWAKYPNFSEKEFACKHSGLCRMDPEFLEKLQLMRTALDFPLPVNSGYRHPTHPIEIAKAEPGEHSTGKAADIGIYGERAYKLLALAPGFGFTRIGVQQKGPNSSRYIHLGTSKDFPNPAIWSY